MRGLTVRTRPRCCRAGAALAVTARDTRIQPVFCAAARSAARAALLNPVTCPDVGWILQERKVSLLESNASHSRANHSLPALSTFRRKAHPRAHVASTRTVTVGTSQVGPRLDAMQSDLLRGDPEIRVGSSRVHHVTASMAP